jgi:hypothetical protein
VSGTGYPRPAGKAEKIVIVDGAHKPVGSFGPATVDPW